MSRPQNSTSPFVGFGRDFTVFGLVNFAGKKLHNVVKITKNVVFGLQLVHNELFNSLGERFVERSQRFDSPARSLDQEF